MRRVATQNLKPNMIIARNVFNSDGRVLLHAGITLDETYIQRLQEIGIVSVYIKDAFFEDVDTVKDVISEQTRIDTIQVVKANFEELENRRKLNIRLVKHVVDNIMDELLSNSSILVQLADIRTFDDYTFAHSVNVCILSLMTGITMGYHQLKLKELGVGALLHDIGKTRIDKSILNKPDDLNKEEFDEIKRHTVYGFNILRQYDDISLLSAHIAFQHHERWDGHGYPRKLKGYQIHEYGRIVAAADVYDALLADRPYRPAYSVTQAITIIKRMADIYLDSHCIAALISNIAIYPIGSIVQLNTRDVGVVVDVNRELPTRPIVRIIYDSSRRRLCKPHEVDLSKLSTIMIVKQLTEEEFGRILRAK